MSYMKLLGEMPKTVADAFPKRPLDAHKYSVGTVTVVGGSSHFMHAPVIAALGARAAGAGLIRLVVPDASRIAAGALVPEATFTKLTPTCVPPVSDVTVMGMGLGISQITELQVSRFLSGSSGRFVLDADALNILAKWYAMKRGPVSIAPGQSLVMTPHAKEAAALLACDVAKVRSDRLGAAREIARRFHAVTVLKGAHTLVVSPESDGYYENPTGNPFMAIGGMGDMLAGVTGARWARLVKANGAASGVSDAYLAACASVWLHGAASDSLVECDPPQDVSLVNTASRIGSMRVYLERNGVNEK